MNNVACGTIRETRFNLGNLDAFIMLHGSRLMLQVGPLLIRWGWGGAGREAADCGPFWEAELILLPMTNC